MKTYTIYEAKTNFSKLVAQALEGETIVIGSHGKPAVELKAITPASKPASMYGAWRGQVSYAPDYDQADVEIAQLVGERLQR
jgi:prevent-host-death family protein